MVHSFCPVFFICVWFSLKAVSSEETTAEEKDIFPVLQDFRVKVSPGFINITWNCNVTESMVKDYTYMVNLQKGNYEDLNVSACSFVYDVHKTTNFEVHKGVSVQLLITNITSDNLHVCKEEIYMPEGKNNSASENFACEVYNVSIMNCSWTVGQEAPEDTQYSLVLRQNLRKTYVECHDYRKDSFGRQLGCVLTRPNISFKSKVYVAVLGLSNQTSIQFFDKVYEPLQDVILDPPRNIALAYNSDELEIKWREPETYDNMTESCFWYKILINDKESGDIPGNEENVYKTTKYHPNEKVTVAMKVKWHEQCSRYSAWSAWSKPITGGDPPPLTPHQILIVFGVLTALLLLLLLLCYRFRIWMKLFPKIPRPSMKLFEHVEQKEKSVPKEAEILTMKIHEDYICSYVTEMPEKLETVNQN